MSFTRPRDRAAARIPLLHWGDKATEGDKTAGGLAELIKAGGGRIEVPKDSRKTTPKGLCFHFTMQGGGGCTRRRCGYAHFDGEDSEVTSLPVRAFIEVKGLLEHKNVHEKIVPTKKGKTIFGMD